MTALEDFVRARLDEQKRRATPRTVVFTDGFGAATLTCIMYPRPYEACGWHVDAAAMAAEERDRIAAEHSMEHASRGQRWMLADAAAKRLILAEHKHYPDSLNPARIACEVCASDRHETYYEVNGWCMTVRLLALPYAAADGYDESWRPA